MKDSYSLLEVCLMVIFMPFTIILYLTTDFLK